MRTKILAALASGLALAGATRAADFGPQAVEPQAVALKVGRLSLWALRDARFVLPNDGKTFGVDAGPAAVAAVLRAAGAPADRITLSVDALLLREPGRVLLFDTGLGAGNHGALLASLRQAGVGPADVTDVLVTHPHMDHIGGLVGADGKPQFPRAVVRLPPAAWTWLQQQSPAVARVIAAQVRTFAPGARVAPGVTSVPLAGHTPGHTGYEIVSGDDRLLDVGDLVHSSLVSPARPQWTVGFDADTAVAKDTRRKELAVLAASGEEVFAPHFPFPGIGHIRAAGDAYRWEPATP